MVSFRSGVLSFLVLSWSRALVTRHRIQEHSEAYPKFIEYWINAQDEVVFYACASHQTMTHKALLAALPKSRTLWSYPKKKLFSLLLENTANNVKTVVFLLAEPHGQADCLGRLKKDPVFGYLTDWIILPGQDIARKRNDPSSMNQTTDGSRNTTSTFIPKKEDQICLSVTGSTAVARRYDQYDAGPRASYISALSGQRIYLACTARVGMYAKKTTSCTIQTFRDVFRALVTLNATLVYKTYGNIKAGLSALIDGSADIFASLVNEEDKGFRFVFYPHPLRYTPAKFYVHRDNKPAKISVYELIGGFHVGLIFLFVITLVVWMALSNFDFFDSGSFRIDALMDSGTFLVATFLANSVPADTGSTGRGMQFCRIGRVIMLTPWLLGIMPLTAYFSSEVTSRFTVTQPPDHVDTTQKLESALDRKEIQPCIVRDGCFYSVVLGKNLNGKHSFEMKLKEAFEQNKATTRHLSDYAYECLKCASRPGFVCLLCAQYECDANVRQNFVESHDSLKLTLATTPVRKSFHLAKAYDQLLRRLFETASPPFYKPLSCYAGMLADVRSDYNDIEKGLSQIIELSDFFWFYYILLSSSFIIFCLELGVRCLRRYAVH